jgi:hypothetical protein
MEQTLNSRQTESSRDAPVLVALRRARCVAVVVLDRHDVIDVQRMKLPGNAPVARGDAIRRAILRLSKDYGVAHIAAEDDACLGALLSCLGRPLRLVSQREAAQILLGTARAGQSDLFLHVLAQHPKLRRFVTVLPATGALGRERWRTLVLLATALGLATIST